MYVCVEMVRIRTCVHVRGELRELHLRRCPPRRVGLDSAGLRRCPRRRPRHDVSDAPRVDRGPRIQRRLGPPRPQGRRAIGNAPALRRRATHRRRFGQGQALPCDGQVSTKSGRPEICPGSARDRPKANPASSACRPHISGHNPLQVSLGLPLNRPPPRSLLGKVGVRVGVGHRTSGARSTLRPSGCCASRPAFQGYLGNLGTRSSRCSSTWMLLREGAAPRSCTGQRKRGRAGRRSRRIVLFPTSRFLLARTAVPRRRAERKRSTSARIRKSTRTR